MTYGIYVTKEIFDIFEDGSKKKVSTSQGWYTDACYNNMKSAKDGGESFAPLKQEEKVVYHIEKR